jgi:protocatechuate 3,4-dioxygenase, beta subunit
MSSIRVTRRRLLAASTAALVLPSAVRAAGKLAATPFQTVGPFYPMLRPLDQDGDLTMIAGNRIAAKGEVIEVAGRVLDRNGIAIKGAKVELWQANSFGRYNHPSEPDTGRAADSGFQGYGVQLTDAEGRYRFKTVKPGPYPIAAGGPVRTPHIHFDVQGRTDRLITQMYFPDEALNASDFVLAEVDDKPSVIAKRAAGAAATMLWDIVLSSG